MGNQDATPRPRLPRWLRWALLGGAGMLGLAVALVVGAYFALRSPAVMERVLPRVSAVLESAAGVRVAADRASIDLLRGAELAGLEVRWSDPERGRARLAVRRLSLRLAGWRLLRGRLLLDELRVSGADVSAEVRLPPAAPAEPAPEPAPEAPWRDLLRALAAPPLAVRARELSVTDSRVDVRLTGPGTDLHYRTAVDLHASARWLPERLAVSTRAGLGREEPGRLTLTLGQGAAPLSVTTRPRLTAEADWGLRRSDGRWVLRVQPLASRLHLTGTEATGPDGLRGEWAALAVSARLEAEPAGTESDGDGEAGALAPLRFALTLDAAADDLRAVRTGTDGGITEARLGSAAPRLEVIGRLIPPGPLPRSLRAELDGGLDLRELALTRAGPEEPRAYRLDTAALTLNGAYGEDGGRLRGRAALEGARLPPLRRAFGAVLKAEAASDPALRGPRAEAELRLDGDPRLSLAAAADNAPGALEVEHRLRADLPAGLAAYHAAAAPLERIGGLRLRWQGVSRLRHGAATVQAADVAGAAAWPAGGEGRIVVEQLGPPAVPALPAWEKPVRLDYRLARAEGYRAKLSLVAPAIRIPPLESPVALAWEGSQRLAWPPAEGRAEGELRLNGDRLAAYDVRVDNAPRRLGLDARLDLAADPAWARYWPALAPLERVGALAARVEAAADLRHPRDTVVDLGPQDLERVAAGADLDVRLRQTRPGGRLRLGAPVTLDQRLSWAPGKAVAAGTLRVTEARIPGRLAVVDLALALDGEAAPGDGTGGGRAELRLSAGRLALLGAGADAGPLDLAPLLSPAAVAVSGSRSRDRIALETARLEAGGGLVEAGVAGELRADGGRGSLAGRLALRPRPELWADPAVSGSGELRVPWRATWNGPRVSAEGDLRFLDLGLEAGPWGVTRLSGRLPFREELFLTGNGGLRFAHLEEADPFQRVAFDRVRPYLDRSFTLTTEEIRGAGLTAGPLLANLELEQNLLRLHRFELGLLDGHLGGELYLDAAPGGMRVGFLGRVTQVDLRPLLGDREGAVAGYAPVSARAAVNLDLARLLLQGRVEITDITRVQLLQVLALLDPKQDDPRLGQVRNALRVAHPERVGLAMQNSLLDLEVALSGLDRPIRVRGVPLTPLLQRYAADRLRILERLPLQP